MTTDVVNRSDHSLSFSDTSYCRAREGCLRRFVSPSVAAVEISRICLACALYVAYVCHLTCVQDKDRARIRDNQRLLRAKRKEHQKKLEQQLSLYHRQGIAASTEIQMAARKVADENKMLRTLLNKLGVNNNNIEVYLQSSADTTADTLSGAPLTDPSAVETLETLLEPRRPRSQRSRRRILPGVKKAEWKREHGGWARLFSDLHRRASSALGRATGCANRRRGLPAWEYLSG